jgi:2-polyprenyl-3-methyl-5-hydroxy-6-metoxy-1,4-benzoquinol methylase
MKDRPAQGDDPFKVFEALAVNAGSGQAEDQGLGNYYYTDPVESRNLDRFIELLNERASSFGRRVLVAACGDGLETEVLIENEFDVVATDFSPNMVMATKRHLAERGIQASSVYTADITELNTFIKPHDFAGVSLAQAAQFIEDDKLQKAINNLASLTPEGLVFLSTTQYSDPEFVRTWAPNGEVVGSTIYRGRPLEHYVELCKQAGLTVVHSEFFDAGDTPPDDYKNLYIIAARD